MGRNSWSDTKTLSQRIATEMIADSPGRYTVSSSKRARQGKIYIDYLRNKFGATAIAPYSTRARPTAAVATPVEWDELATLGSAAAFTVTNLPRRLDHQDRDPWADMLTTMQTITKDMLRILDT